MPQKVPSSLTAATNVGAMLAAKDTHDLRCDNSINHAANRSSNNEPNAQKVGVAEDANKQWAQQQTVGPADCEAFGSNDSSAADSVAPTTQTIPTAATATTTNGSATPDNLSPKQQDATPPSFNTTNATTSTTTPAPATTAKLNGLKNRIIQRPPPLMLDKVSNFYDNVTNASIVQPHQQQSRSQQQQQQQPQHPLAGTNAAGGANNAAFDDSPDHQLQQQTSRQEQQNEFELSNSSSHSIINASHSSAVVSDAIASVDAQSPMGNNADHNNGNKKFWASLNENAHRNKIKTSSSSSSRPSARSNKPATSDSVPQSFQDTNGSLGPDLIIKHRNNSAHSTPFRSISGRRQSHLSQSHSNSLDYQRINHEQHPTPPPLHHHHHHSNQSYDIQSDIQVLNDGGNSALSSQVQFRHDPHDVRQTNHQRLSDNGDLSRARATSNASNELDEGGAPSENGLLSGGNLIGVDNSTPPATGHDSRFDNPPTSATSSRPRSNNPFLDDDVNKESEHECQKTTATNDLELDQPTTASLQGNFHKRPASFIAATERPARIMKSPHQHHQASQIVEEKFNGLNLTDWRQSNASPPTSANGDSMEAPSDYFALNQLDSHATGLSQCTASVNQMSLLSDKHQIHAPNHHHHHHHHQYHQTLDDRLAGNREPRTYYSPGTRFQEPTISVDSESAVCQLPPSKTMQLPHWTEATYELNNAILETSSVAGGAEKGQFIYIIENGDIILELDRVQVSGFTLVEFNELVESRQFHLLNAVQTKHSHSLTNDLKSFLNQSFSKSSKDRQLQMLIRENIYRRTIPCTTRPSKPGERNGVDYHFLTQEQFINLSNRDMLLECGVYLGHYYGTLKPCCDLSELSIYSPSVVQEEPFQGLRQAWDANHPAVDMRARKGSLQPQATQTFGPSPLYENNESLRIQERLSYSSVHQQASDLQAPEPSIVAVDSEALPPGWERVVDQTHGTYYIDHNTKRTQYERPYEVDLTKSAMGFGFTLVEADNGLLLVRSVISGGPAQMNGFIRPGDILISAVGVSVTGLQHTDIARLFSTFAVGDCVRLTFARTNYVLDDNLIPDEYLFSNGTNGDMAIAVNPNSYRPPSLHQEQQQHHVDATASSPYILVDQEFEFVTVVLKRGDQGFGFTISNSIAGQKVSEIQNHQVCSNLKQGDILISLNNQDITELTHKDVVEQLKRCPPGRDVTLTVKRKRRTRSKTPSSMHTGQLEANSSEFMHNENGEPHRNSNNQMHQLDMVAASRRLLQSDNNIKEDDCGSLTRASDFQFVHPPNGMNAFNMPGSELSQVNQYNNFMNNDKLMMMQMQQQQVYQQMQAGTAALADNRHVPLYSNCDILNGPTNNQQQQHHQQQLPATHGYMPALPIKPPAGEFYSHFQAAGDSCQNNFYANNEEIALQNVQYNLAAGAAPYMNGAHSMPLVEDRFDFVQPSGLCQETQTPHDEHDEYEYHHVELTRANNDSNWGIRLIGGAEVERAISIGSMIFGGVAAKSGKLKSGDEIISIDGVSVVGATHHHVVDMISARTNRVLLVVRRKTFAEACDVVLTKNMDEGFGFVIISSENCALIGKIIEGSPADRCRQLRVRDCIIAVNGRYITPDMKHPEIVNMIKECGSTLRLRIIPVDCYTVKLIKDVQNDSFGFRMRGGSEYDGTPLYIVRVETNGQAHGLLNAGDQILEINNIPTVGMTHSQAATIIKYSDPIVKLKLRRNYVTPASLLVDSPRALQKYNQVTAEMKAVSQSHYGSREEPISSSSQINAVADHGGVSFASLPADLDNVAARGHIAWQQQPHQHHQRIDTTSMVGGAEEQRRID